MMCLVMDLALTTAPLSHHSRVASQRSLIGTLVSFVAGRHGSINTDGDL